MRTEVEGLDLDALEKVAREATPGDREAWSSIYEGMTAAIVVPGCDPLKTIAEVRSHYDDAVFLATFDPPTVLRLLAALRAQAELVRVLEGERDEYGEIGERDGYERAVQDIDLLTGGDGEYRVSTQAARSCPDVATMKTRIAARFAEGQSAIERLMEQKRTTKALGCPHYGDLALRCAAAEARAEAAERRAGELEGALSALIVHFEGDEQHDEGAFDIECPDCVALEAARARLAEGEK